MQLIARALIAVALLLSCSNDPADAQQKALAPAAVPAQPSLPVTLEQALYLIRSTLLTLNDANRTGNYTVLRDLAAPDFQARNTAADLGLNFLDLRRRNFDLYGAALLRRNSPKRHRSTRAECCALPVTFRPSRSRSSSISCFRSPPDNGDCSEDRYRHARSRTPAAASPGGSRETGRACAEEVTMRHQTAAPAQPRGQSA